MMNRAKTLADVPQWAESLGVSETACRLLVNTDFIDLHLDLEVSVRLLNYDPTKRHRVRQRPLPLFCQTDFPRLIEAGFSGVVYDIATNPLRRPKNRLQVTLDNLERVQLRVSEHPSQLAIVRSVAEYRAARAQGQLALWLSLQGGNALIDDPGVLEGDVGALLHRITLVHMTRSGLGGTSSPFGGDNGLTALGAEFVGLCNRARILVDLAHAGKQTFWEALAAHDRSVSPIVSHTGVSAVHSHWRNLDDAQIKAIADRGGVIGVMYHSTYLEPVLTYGTRQAIVAHLAHIVALVGDDFAAIGTDYDGAIIPPADFPDVTHHPLLVQDMLDRGWSEQRIQKILGLNALRVAEAIRPSN
jgi:membrane dipeptidase